MKTKDFFYELPEELIAQTPLKTRTDSKLLVLNKASGDIEHREFKDIINYMESGDTLVLNDTRVIPARLYGNRQGKIESIEFLLLKNIEGDIWEVLVKPGKKARPGMAIEFGNGLLVGRVLSIEDDGTRYVEFSYKGIFIEILDRLGEMPLPPYIRETLGEKERYQTVYSKNPGSAAAPTAGLHFTKELLKDIEAKGINIAYITLHVGLGTFRPVKVENIEDHLMHSEYFIVSDESAYIINKSKTNGKKVISVGTTSSRVLETIANEDGMIGGSSGWTDIFIWPGYKFKLVDSLITNFHLPESTLMMLVSAFASKEFIFHAYNSAIENKYRFFSFGDAMLII